MAAAAVPEMPSQTVGTKVMACNLLRRCGAPSEGCWWLGKHQITGVNPCHSPRSYPTLFFVTTPVFRLAILPIMIRAIVLIPAFLFLLKPHSYPQCPQRLYLVRLIVLLAGA